MHVWVASWITEEHDQYGRRKFKHRAYSNVHEAKRRTEGLLKMVVDWEEHRDKHGEVTRVEGLLDGANSGTGSPAVIERVDVHHPSSFIGELTRK